MPTLLLSHPASLAHQTPPGHPERPDRIRAIEQVLNGEKFATLVRAEAPMAETELLTLCHPEDYVDALREAAPREGMVRIDADTAMSPGTWEAALRAAGGAVAAVDAVFAGSADNAFVCTRPPGHHAETRQAMGFCFFNNAAIAARHAQKKHGIARAAVVDFDVHHGNGTQDIFWADASVLYASTHQMPLYPGTGAKSERGAANTIVNAPLGAGDGGEAFREAFETVILPRLRDFQPELVVVSAGFDAHHRDPLGNLKLTEDDFSWATLKLMDQAARTAEGRLVSVLEGGYDLHGLSRSVGAHVQALMGT
jgi:acetoin utilization deacetylase AcuC-like enzyme